MDHPDNLTWHTSSHSGSNGGNCLQAAATAYAIAIRDSKDPHGPVLTFGPHDWQRFTSQIKTTPAND